MAEIESGHYDLVVLGSRGHGGLTTEIHGSVNNHVHYHTNVLTLTIDVREAAKANEQTERGTAEVA